MPPPNVLPTVSLTVPAPSTTFPAPGSIALQATGADTDGTLARIDFYAGATLIGTATGAPYTVKWTGVPAGTYAVTAVATDDSGGTATSAAVNLSVTTASVNVAVQANGGVATASSNYSASFPAAAVVNGDRKGVGNGSGGTWTDGTRHVYPDWIEVAFNGQRAIGEIDVFTLQDAYTNPAVPTETMVSNAFAMTAYEVQAWNGSTWATVPGGAVTANNKVWRKFTFTPLVTDRIRVLVSGTVDGYARMTEVEAWTPAGLQPNLPPVVTLGSLAPNASLPAPGPIALQATASDWDGSIAGVEFFANGSLIGTATTAPYVVQWNGVAIGSYTLTARATDNAGATTTSAAIPVTVTAGRINVAAQANGGVATASSTHPSGYAAAGAINGDRKGLAWNSGGSWTDGTQHSYPDWLQVAFAGARTIDEVDVFTLQDAYTNPVAPTETLVTNSFAVTGFEVQTWNGSAWVTVPGGAVTGNNKVWRRFTFAPVSTDRIRVRVNAAYDGYARITEVEAWTAAPANTPPAVSLTAPGPNANFPAPATIDLAASASDAEGRVVQVQFLQGSTPIWTASQAPFTATWTNVPAGSYVLTARATDLLGATTTSAPVAVSVGTAASNLFFVNPDHLNTPRSIADSAGREVWRWDQGDPFGGNLPNQDADGDGQAMAYNLRFPGQYYDAETGLHYNYFRDYDPGTGRYVESDPIGLRGGVNTYAYVKDNPLKYSDPLGLEAEMCYRPVQGFIIPGQHCFIRFDGNSNDTLSFDPRGVGPDPAPKGATCEASRGSQGDDCVKREMKKCQDYNFFTNNCCHCAEQALKACGQSVPAKKWPNYPINPGPQQGEPGYRP